MEIDTGDHVLHGPTRETWVVARVLGDKLAWCGWPQGWANLADCTLVKKACPESRLRLLREIAGSSGHHCAEWAAGQINRANQMTAQNHALEQARLQYESIKQMPTELDIDYERLADTGADSLRQALWICVEHNALHFGETHNTVVQGRAALASTAQRDPLRAYADADRAMRATKAAPTSHERDEAINILARFAEGLTTHKYSGDCPSDESPKSRDPQCMVCWAIDAARSAQGESNG